MKKTKKSVKDIIPFLKEFHKKYNAYLKEVISHKKSIKALKKKYKGYTNVMDFPYYFDVNFNEIKTLTEEEYNLLGLPDYFYELEGDIGKETEYGKIIGLRWYLDDLCFIISGNKIIRLWPVFANIFLEK